MATNPSLPAPGHQPNQAPSPSPSRWWLGMALALLLFVLGFGGVGGGVAPAWAITAPELRGQRSLQDLQPDMHGRNLRQQEFLKADLEIGRAHV